MCRSSETTLFSCTFEKTVISVCRQGGRPIARMKKPGAAGTVSRNLSFASEGYSGGGQSQISFGSAARKIIVYDKLIRTGFDASGQNDAELSTGAMVVQNGKVVSHQQCRQATRIGGVSNAEKGARPTDIFED